MAAEEALKLKGVDYKRVELPELGHIPFQKLRFGAPTVPGIVFDDGEKVIGSRAIMERLDERVAEPPLYPSDPSERAKVKEADRWGDDVLQSMARRAVWWALRRDAAPMPSFLEGAKLPFPTPLVRVIGPGVARMASSVHKATDEAIAEDMRRLPEDLDRVDGYIADGVIGTDPPNAADLQILSSIWLLLAFADLRPLIEDRPCGRLARERFPASTGDVPAGTLPLPAMAPAAAVG
jgi:glutathione S-transferase